MNADVAFTYTELAVFSVLVMVVWDLLIIRTQLLKTKIFWASYAIIVFFQLVSNGLLTGYQMVRYFDEAIIGSGSVEPGTPQMLGDGRIFYAPVEDLLFGFSLVMLTLTLWIFWERKGIANSIVSGPPRISLFGPKK